MASDTDDESSPIADLATYLQDPEAARRRLPYVVGMLESDDELTRLAAAWTCCMAAVQTDDSVEYLVKRLSDRLSEEEVSLELTAALDYIASKYPEQVEKIIEDLDEEEAERGEIPLPETGSFTRSHYYSYEPDRSGVGRTRIAGADAEEGGRRTYTQGEPDEEEKEERRDEGEDEAEEDESEDDAEEDAEGPAPGEDDEGAGYIDNPGALVKRTTNVSSIATRSRFDQLHILSTHTRDRYADNYQALVGRGGEEMAVALRILHIPKNEAERLEFEDDIEAEIRRWAEIDGHTHMMEVLDWGAEPRPWLATSFAGDTLADQDLFSVDRALEEGIALAEAVAHAHHNDVVHGGIDPENVAYPEDVIAGNDQEPPLLNNVGLMHVFRYHAKPELVLDPRYAAPEYYDTQFGNVDPATDIYQLGAVLFRLFAGRPPYTGTQSEVREAILADHIPVPGDVLETIPEAVDQVVAKAMAPQKLTRYETVEHLLQELTSIKEARPDEY